MTRDQVRQALGNPADIVPLKTPSGEVEKWIYRRRVDEQVDQKPTGTQDVPYVDPFTGQMRTIQEPTYSLVTTTVTEVVYVFWSDGELVNWNTVYRGDRAYE